MELMVRGNGEYKEERGGQGSVVRVRHMEFQNGSKGQKLELGTGM